MPRAPSVSVGNPGEMPGSAPPARKPGALLPRTTSCVVWKNGGAALEVRFAYVRSNDRLDPPRITHLLPVPGEYAKPRRGDQSFGLNDGLPKLIPLGTLAGAL